MPNRKTAAKLNKLCSWSTPQLLYFSSISSPNFCHVCIIFIEERSIGDLGKVNLCWQPQSLLNIGSYALPTFIRNKWKEKNSKFNTKMSKAVWELWKKPILPCQLKTEKKEQTVPSKYLLKKNNAASLSFSYIYINV